MSLSYFDSLGKVWRKCEREAYRAFHARSHVHQADHFFNFCVTAHSLRDYYLEHANVPGTSRESFDKTWNQEPALVAARDIANRSKHFRLRNQPSTRSARQTTAAVMDVYYSPERGFAFDRRDAPNVVVRTDNGDVYQLYEFTRTVLDYWRQFLRGNGVKVRRQTVEELLGSAQ